MSDYALPALFAVLVWWFTTGAILYLDGLPRRTHYFSMLGATVLAACGVVALKRSVVDATPGGAYLGFCAAIVLWGWLEMGFLMGYVTGPRSGAASPGSRGWRRFGEAAGTVIHHELAILAFGAGVCWACSGSANPVAWWTFAVLWAMRLSAKLNLFLGVPNVNAELLPEHLRYLGSYFRKRAMNPLFPVSVTLATATVGWLLVLLNEAGAGSGAAVALTLVTALLALAVLEHGFMVLPLPANELWRWAIRPRPAAPLPAVDPQAGEPGCSMRSAALATAGESISPVN